MVKRLYEDGLVQRLGEQPNKIIILYGARQVGKTTLVKTVLQALPGRHLFINAEDTDYTDVLSSRYPGSHFEVVNRDNYLSFLM